MYRRDVWSLSLGHWGWVHVRLHMFFLLFTAFTFYLAWHVNQTQEGLGWIGLECIVILALSVLAHEFGHYITAMQLGSPMDAIVLGPLGGLSPVRVGRDPQRQLIAVLAGPLTSLAVAVLCMVAIAFDGRTSAFDLLNVLSPGNIIAIGIEGENVWLVRCLRLTCWINWMLVVVNMIPAFPFDGGTACTSFLLSIRRGIEPRQATMVVAALAKVCAICLLVAAWFVGEGSVDSPFPTWLALVLLAIFVFFSARLEESLMESDENSDDLFGYDFSQGYTSLERSVGDKRESGGLLTRWLEEHRKARHEKKVATELAEDRHVDEILSRLHDRGIANLTPSERALLQRVSARYRQRDT